MKKTTTPKTKKGTKTPTQPDWQKIAKALAGQLLWVLQNIQAKGTGAVIDTSTYETRHWKEHLADTLELYPGMKIDREAMHALDLPKKQRDKFFKERAAAKSEEEKP